MKKVYLVSLGCSRNLVDSEVMLGVLVKGGYEISLMAEESDVIIVNTCGFLQSAKLEAIQVIEELFKIKKKKAKIIVTGCLVQREGSGLRKIFPEIHFLLGAGNILDILTALQSRRGEKISLEKKSFLECANVPRLLSTPSHYAYLKVSEGCSKGCAFCLIPKIKGKLQSKNIEQIKEEFCALLDLNVFEIITIAQNLGDFGKDRSNKELAKLLRELLKEKRDFWLRLLYLYPDDIDDEFIEILGSDGRICPYLDIPLQHISDKILKKMKRTTDKRTILQTIEKLRKKVPNIAIRTTLMVGFPGEEESDFKDLCKFVHEYSLEHVGIFKFSKEDGTAAATFDNQVDEEIKEERFKKLAKIQLETLQISQTKLIGQKIDLLIDEMGTNCFVGHSQRQAPEVDGRVLLTTKRRLKIGSRCSATITGFQDYDLIANYE